MSVMEKRLQLLLDRERYERVEAEARRSGRSVAAVIREAIDVRFDSSATRRAEAARLFLERTATPDPGREPEWAEIKQSFEDDMAERFDRLAEQ